MYLPPCPARKERSSCFSQVINKTISFYSLIRIFRLWNFKIAAKEIQGDLHEGRPQYTEIRKLRREGVSCKDGFPRRLMQDGLFGPCWCPQGWRAPGRGQSRTHHRVSFFHELLERDSATARDQRECVCSVVVNMLHTND